MFHIFCCSLFHLQRNVVFGTNRCAALFSLPLFISLREAVITCCMHFYENFYWRVIHTLSTHRTFGQSRDDNGYMTEKQTYVCMPCECNLSSYAYWRELCCCILHGPGGERIVNVVPGGTEVEPQVGGGGRPHTLTIIPASSVLEFIVHKQ
jgi:hypothetical protein